MHLFSESKLNGNEYIEKQNHLFPKSNSEKTPPCLEIHTSHSLVGFFSWGKGLGRQIVKKNMDVYF